jgi:hypothetical protein
VTTLGGRAAIRFPRPLPGGDQARLAKERLVPFALTQGDVAGISLPGVAVPLLPQPRPGLRAPGGTVKLATASWNSRIR